MMISPYRLGNPKGGDNVQRWLITEIGKTTVRQSIWSQISHLSAYNRGLWLLQNLRWRVLTEPFTGGLVAFTTTIFKGPTVAGWVGTGVLIGSTVAWADEVLARARRTLGIKEPDE